jgi:hypothetical protein
MNNDPLLLIIRLKALTLLIAPLLSDLLNISISLMLSDTASHTSWTIWLRLSLNHSSLQDFHRKYIGKSTSSSTNEERTLT